MRTKTKLAGIAPRHITPHNGGRSKRFGCRCTPETLTAIKASGKTDGDFL